MQDGGSEIYNNFTFSCSEVILLDFARPCYIAASHSSLGAISGFTIIGIPVVINTFVNTAYKGEP